MSVHAELNELFADNAAVENIAVNKDADNHGRKGTAVIIELSDGATLEMYYADNNKLNNSTVVALVKRKIESYLNGTAEKENTA